MDEIYAQAVKLLRARDYTVAMLRGRLELKFGSVPDAIIDELLRKNYLNDRRFAENYAGKRKHRGAATVREELIARGIPAAMADEILSETGWPSLREALAAKMNHWNLRAPLQSRDAARHFR